MKLQVVVKSDPVSLQRVHFLKFGSLFCPSIDFIILFLLFYQHASFGDVGGELK